MSSTDKHQTIDELLNQHDFFVDLPAGSITKSSAKKAFKEWLEQQRPKSIESTDEIIVNDFIDHLVKGLSL